LPPRLNRATMQMMSPLLLFGSLYAVASGANPMGTVLQLMDDLAAKITKDGEAEAKAYAEYVEWCDDTAKNTGFAIETAEKEKANLEAQIAELGSNIAAAGSNIDGLAASIATGQAELNDATTIRNKEASDFAASDAELVDSIDTLGRAIGILSKVAKNPASFAQLNTESAQRAVKALSAVLDAAAFSTQDQTKLTALVQSQQSDEADDLELGAPAGEG